MSEKQWYVAQNGQSIGPMSEQKLKAGLSGGTYSPSDHVFSEGMKGWVPASSVTEFAGTAPAVPPPPPAGAKAADEVDYDAIILAAAGLERLGLDHYISHQFSPDEMLPAAAQGVVGIECLESNDALRAILQQLTHEPTALTTAAERAIAKTLDANCQSPVATYAVIDGSSLTVTALVALPDGSKSVRDVITGPAEDAERLGEELATRLLASGAGEILAALGESHG